jgi:hypothetical protein
VIAQVLRTTLLALGAGFLCQLAQDWLVSQYFTEFLKTNLINILIALLAVNSATMGIVLTKLRELIEKHGHAGEFKQTRAQFLLSVKEQVVLIAAAILLLTLQQSKYLKDIPNSGLFFGSAVAAIFIYSMMILYDTAQGVLIIIDYSAETEA